MPDQPTPAADLAYLPAAEAIRSFRNGELSPVELMEAVIARAEIVEPSVNAFADSAFERALENAREAEARYRGRGPEPRPLEGIPVAVKEEAPIEGDPWTLGSLVYRDQVADNTAVFVQRIIDAGGIVHARTKTPEFSCAPFTHSRLWGVTRNPWNRECSPGGSSGGSGAALAAGSTTLATGSDIGGSIRIPASFCGVVGFKPPYGRVPEMEVFNLDHYCHEGPLARTVGDCALLENVIAGPHPSDVASLRPKLEIPDDFVGIQGWRIALSENLGCFEVDQDVARNTRETADALRDAGAVVEEVALPWTLDEITHAARIHFGMIFGAWVADIYAEHRDELTAYARQFAEEAMAVPKEAFVEGLAVEAKIYAPLGQLLEDFDALVCPTVAVAALEAGEDYVDVGPTVNGRRLDSWYEVLMTIPFNIASRCPVLAVPSGFSTSGVPTGLSIVGRTYDDVSVFRVGAALERARPWLDTSERRPRL